MQNKINNEFISILKCKDKNYELFVNDLVCNKFGIAELFCKHFYELKSLNYINGYGLDVGCGVGPISIFLADSGYKIDGIEINGIACNLMKKNIDKYGFNNSINIIRNDFSTYSFESKYNFIVTNPPIRVGKKILYKLLFEAKNYLNKNGELWLVVNKDQGAKSLVKDLSKEYETTIICKNKGFFIIRAINN